MAQTLDRGNQAQVEGVASVIGKRPYAAFAQNDVVVPFAHHVLGGHQKFFQRCRHAALQQNRFAGTASALE